MNSDVTAAADAPPQPPTTMPAVEAFAHAIAVTAHQHAGAVPEDSPHTPVQARLPIPRPPFDVERAFQRIAEKRAEVLDLGKVWEGANRLAKKAKQDFEDADGELKELLDELIGEQNTYLDALDNPEQINLPHGAECAWEREHPGQVCGVCQEARDTVRAARDAEQISQEMQADSAIAVEVVVEEPAAQALGADVASEAPPAEPEEA